MALSLFYLFQIGYTTSDDVQIAQQTFVESYKNAKEAGRLTWVMAMPSGLLSEVQGSIWYSKILRLVWVGALFHAAYLLLREKFAVTPAIFIGLFPAIFFVNDWDHHAFSSYPGLVTYAFACFLYSLHFFNSYINKGSKVALLLSVIFFVLSFVTELFPTLFIFLVLYPSSSPIKRLNKSILHLILILIFLLLYIQFKSNTQTYPLLFSWDAIKTWFIYSYSQIYDLSIIFIYSIKNFSAFFYVKISLLSLIIIYIIYINKVYIIKNIKNSTIYLNIILWWLLLSAWINIPVALTQNYQTWVAGGSKAYLYSALSNFSLTTGLGVLSLGILSRFYGKRWLWVMTCLVLVFILISHQIKSFTVYRQQMYSHSRWVIVDELAKNGHLKSDVCYIAPWLFELNGIVMIRTLDYWSLYLQKNWSIDSHILKSTEDRKCESYENLFDSRIKPL